MMRSYRTPKGTDLPLLNLRGKEYLEVKYRLVWFREEHSDWTIETELISVTESTAFAKATIRDNTGRIVATSHKFETKQGFPDFIEKAETGAIGRALALIGFGTQFCADEFDEGERIVDAPAAPVSRPKAEAKKPASKPTGQAPASKPEAKPATPAPTAPPAAATVAKPAALSVVPNEPKKVEKLNREILKDEKIKYGSELKGKTFSQVGDDALVAYIRKMDLAFAAKGMTEWSSEYALLRKQVEAFTMLIISKPLATEIAAEKAKLVKDPNPIESARENSSTASSDPGEYVATFGKFKGHALKNFQIADIEAYCGHIRNEAVKKGEDIKGQVGEFMTAATLWVGMNTPPEDDGPPPDFSADFDDPVNVGAR